MSLTRWDPAQELTPLREAMNRLLEDSFVGLGRFDVFGRTFPVDIREMPEEYIVEATLPGFKPEDLVVTATYDTLTIRALHKAEQKPEQPEKHLRAPRALRGRGQPDHRAADPHQRGEGGGQLHAWHADTAHPEG